MLQNIESAILLWNATLLRFFRRWWPLYGRALEGEYLFFIWSPVTIFLPLILLIFGFLIGGWHLGYQFVLMESFSLMVLIVLFSFLSTRLGALFWAGYLLGDFLLFRLQYMRHNYLGKMALGSLSIGLPLVIYYTLLLFLLVSIPTLIQVLTRQTLDSLRLNTSTNKIVDALLQSVLAGFFVYFWNQAYPILIRPLWTWHGLYPSPQAIEPIQKMGWILVVCAIVATIAKCYLEERFKNRAPKKMEKAKAESQRRRAPLPRFIQLPKPLSVLIKGLFTTFLLSGMILKWWDALLLLTVLSFLYALQADLYLKLPERWTQWLTKFPTLIRLTVAIGVSWILSEHIHQLLWKFSQNTFLPIIVSLSFSLLLIYLMCPKEAQKRASFSANLKDGKNNDDP